MQRPAGRFRAPAGDARHRPPPRAAAIVRPTQPAPLAAGETRAVTIETDLGTMTLTIEADLSPIAAGNFVALAGCGFYDGVVFHRRRAGVRHPGR